ncbi:hypothetical protein ACTFIZ_012875 [Dictyostelium cf. discoideum]
MNNSINNLSNVNKKRGREQGWNAANADKNMPNIVNEDKGISGEKNNKRSIVNNIKFESRSQKLSELPIPATINFEQINNQIELNAIDAQVSLAIYSNDINSLLGIFNKLDGENCLKMVTKFSRQNKPELFLQIVDSWKNKDFTFDQEFLTRAISFDWSLELFNHMQEHNVKRIDKPTLGSIVKYCYTTTKRNEQGGYVAINESYPIACIQSPVKNAATKDCLE